MILVAREIVLVALQWHMGLYIVRRPLVLIASVVQPRTVAHPAKFMATRTAGHMVAAAIFFDIHRTLWALACILQNPLVRFNVVNCRSAPFLQQDACNRLVEEFTAWKTKFIAALASDRLGFHPFNAYGICAVDPWTPSHQWVAQNVRIGDGPLEFILNFGLFHQFQYHCVVDQDLAIVRCTRYHFRLTCKIIKMHNAWNRR